MYVCIYIYIYEIYIYIYVIYIYIYIYIYILGSRANHQTERGTSKDRYTCKRTKSKRLRRLHRRRSGDLQQAMVNVANGLLRPTATTCFRSNVIRREWKSTRSI